MTEADGEFVRTVVKGENPGKAYISSYGDDGCKNPGAKARAVLNDPDIKKSILELLARDGITLRKTNNKLKQKLEAKKAVILSENSRVEYVDDNTTQMDAIKTVYKLYGKLNENPNVQINAAIFNPELIDRLRETIPIEKPIDVNKVAGV